MDTQQEGYVKSHIDHGITTIEFFHPQSNSLPSHLLNTLAQEIHYAGSHDGKIILLKSAGEGAFCAGASFDELLQIKNESEGLKFFMGFANVINAMRLCHKLIVGRIHGKCVGGGVGIAAAVDYAIAVKGAEIKLSELAVGIGPFVVGPAIERKIGTSAFSQIAIDATLWRNEDWAKKKGLFAEVHPTVSDMDDSIERLTSTLAHSSPEAMKNMKNIFWKDTDHWGILLKERAKISGQLVLSEFTRNAINSFKKK
ncbi:MAG: enoyl-CoA hydratase/isomerase family protein [Ginsengibacter sp.]